MEIFNWTVLSTDSMKLMNAVSVISSVCNYSRLFEMMDLKFDENKKHL